MLERTEVLTRQAEETQKIKCDCCGSETLAEIRGDKVVIMDRRHGRKHIVVLTLRDIIDKMKRRSSGV